MAEIIDVRNSDGYLVVLGNALILPNSSTTSGVFPPYKGAIRFNNTSNVCEYYTTQWNQFGSSGGGSGLTFVNITGDATGSTTTGNLTLTLASVSTAGTYSNLTIDAKGRVLTIRALNASDITTALTYTPVNSNGGTFSSVPSVPTASLTDVSLKATNTTWVSEYVAEKVLITLSSTLNLYVSTSGNDNNPGTSSAPFATLTGAYNTLVSQYNLNSQNININVANGTYGPQIISGCPVGFNQNSINIVGNNTTPTNVVFASTGANNALTIQNGANVSITGISFSSTQGSGIYIQSAVANLEVVNFGACLDAYHIFAATGSYFQLSSSYTISAGAQSHILVGSNGSCLLSGSGTVQNSCSFPQSFAIATTAGSIVIGIGFYYDIPSGVVVTGSRATATLNGIINTQGQGTTLLPGNSVATSSLGGQFG